MVVETSCSYSSHTFSHGASRVTVSKEHHKDAIVLSLGNVRLNKGHVQHPYLNALDAELMGLAAVDKEVDGLLGLLDEGLGSLLTGDGFLQVDQLGTD